MVKFEEPDIYALKYKVHEAYDMYTGDYNPAGDYDPGFEEMRDVYMKGFINGLLALIDISKRDILLEHLEKLERQPSKPNTK